MKILKKTGALLCAAAVLLAQVSGFPAFAAAVQNDLQVDGRWLSWKEFCANDNNYAGKTVRLMRNIKLGGTANNVPTKDGKFEGAFDGQGYHIVITADSAFESPSNADDLGRVNNGLFEQISGSGEVKNLVVELQGDLYASRAVQSNPAGDNSERPARAGVLAGRMTGSAKLTACAVLCGQGGGGRFIAYRPNGIQNDMSVGALAGEMIENTSVSGCFADIDLRAALTDKEDVSDYLYLGGLVGATQGTASVLNSASRSQSIEGGAPFPAKNDHRSLCIGGIVGRAKGNSGIRSCLVYPPRIAHYDVDENKTSHSKTIVWNVTNDGRGGKAAGYLQDKAAVSGCVGDAICASVDRWRRDVPAADSSAIRQNLGSANWSNTESKLPSPGWMVAASLPKTVKVAFDAQGKARLQVEPPYVDFNGDGVFTKDNDPVIGRKDGQWEYTITAPVKGRMGTPGGLETVRSQAVERVELAPAASAGVPPVFYGGETYAFNVTVVGKDLGVLTQDALTWKVTDGSGKDVTAAWTANGKGYVTPAEDFTGTAAVSVAARIDGLDYSSSPFSMFIRSPSEKTVSAQASLKKLGEGDATITGLRGGVGATATLSVSASPGDATIGESVNLQAVQWSSTPGGKSGVGGNFVYRLSERGGHVVTASYTTGAGIPLQARFLIEAGPDSPPAPGEVKAQQNDSLAVSYQAVILPGSQQGAAYEYRLNPSQDDEGFTPYTDKIALPSNAAAVDIRTSADDTHAASQTLRYTVSWASGVPAVSLASSDIKPGSAQTDSNTVSFDGIFDAGDADLLKNGMDIEAALKNSSGNAGKDLAAGEIQAKVSIDSTPYGVSKRDSRFVHSDKVGGAASGGESTVRPVVEPAAAGEFIEPETGIRIRSGDGDTAADLYYTLTPDGDEKAYADPDPSLYDEHNPNGRVKRYHGEFIGFPSGASEFTVAARAVASGKKPSETVSVTYRYSENIPLPVAPTLLIGEDKLLFDPGALYDPGTRLYLEHPLLGGSDGVIRYTLGEGASAPSKYNGTVYDPQNPPALPGNGGSQRIQAAFIEKGDIGLVGETLDQTVRIRQQLQEPEAFLYPSADGLPRSGDTLYLTLAPGTLSKIDPTGDKLSLQTYKAGIDSGIPRAAGSDDPMPGFSYVSVTLKEGESLALPDIRYRTDGGDALTAGTRFVYGLREVIRSADANGGESYTVRYRNPTAPILLSGDPGASAEVRAATIANSEETIDSGVRVFSYELLGAVKEPSAFPATTTANPAQLSVGGAIELTCDETNTAIYYTTDGTAPKAAYHNGAWTPASVSTRLYDPADPLRILSDTPSLLNLNAMAVALDNSKEKSAIRLFRYKIDSLPRAAPPEGTPATGSEAAEVAGRSLIRLTSGTSGVKIFYTLNGDTPDPAAASSAAPTVIGQAGTFLYSGGIPMLADSANPYVTVTAIAADTNQPAAYTQSEIVRLTYRLQRASAPAPVSGTDGSDVVAGGTLLHLTSDTPGVGVYYTVDGSTPIPSAGAQTATPTAPGQPGTFLYKSGIPVLAGGDNPSFTITAVAADLDSPAAYAQSETTRLTYRLQAAQLPVSTPETSTDNIATLEPGTQIVLTSATPGASVYYSDDGSEPDALFPAGGLRMPQQLSGFYTLRAVAKAAGYADSAQAIFSYQLPAPVQPVMANPPGGKVVDGSAVKLTTTTADAQILYTTDGSDPAPGSASTYDAASPIILHEDVTLRAAAIKSGILSTATEYSFTVADKLSNPEALLKDGSVVGKGTRIQLYAQRGSIAYTLDGSDPRKPEETAGQQEGGGSGGGGVSITVQTGEKEKESSKINYGTDVTLDGKPGETVTVQAYAYENGYTPSDTVSFSYTIVDEEDYLTATPAPENVIGAGEQITLSTGLTDARIFYTTAQGTPEIRNRYESGWEKDAKDADEDADDEDADDEDTGNIRKRSSWQAHGDTKEGSVVTAEGEPGGSFTIRAMAVADNAQGGAVKVFTYKLRERTPAPTASIPSSAIVLSEAMISLTAKEGDIFYTTDGTDPTTSSALYAQPFAPGGSMVLKAIAVAEGKEPSEIVQYVYTRAGQVAAPQMSAASGAIEQGTKISLTCATEEADIYYTLDNSEPTVESLRYEGAIVVMRPVTLKAKAFKVGMDDSAVNTASYTVVTPPQPQPDAEDPELPARQQTDRLASRRSYANEIEGPSLKGVLAADLEAGAVLGGEEGAFPADARLIVEKVEPSDADRTAVGAGNALAALYTVRLERGGEPVTPNGRIELGLPIPEGRENALVSLSRIEDGTGQLLQTRRSGGIAYVVTDRLGRFALIIPELAAVSASSAQATGGYLALAGVGLLALAAAVLFVVLRRRGKDRRESEM